MMVRTVEEMSKIYSLADSVKGSNWMHWKVLECLDFQEV